MGSQKSKPKKKTKKAICMDCEYLEKMTAPCRKCEDGSHFKMRVEKGDRR